MVLGFRPKAERVIRIEVAHCPWEICSWNILFTSSGSVDTWEQYVGHAAILKNFYVRFRNNFKILFKGNNFADRDNREMKGGKLDFYHHFAYFRLTSWKERPFCLVASFSARLEDNFQKKICPNLTSPLDFVKFGSEILYLFLAEKIVVCCLFVCFVAILSDFCLLFLTRICASLGSRMKFKTLCYPVFGRNKNTVLPSFWFPIILIAFNASIICPWNNYRPLGVWLSWVCSSCYYVTIRP